MPLFPLKYYSHPFQLPVVKGKLGVFSNVSSVIASPFKIRFGKLGTFRNINKCLFQK
jgi:hypothetical protein